MADPSTAGSGRYAPTGPDPATPATPAASGSADTSGPEPAGPDLARAALARARAEARRRSAAGAPGERRPGGATGSGGAPGTGRGRWPGRGEEPRSGPGPDERDPQRLGPAIARLLRERGWETAAAAGGLVARWGQIVGPDLAAHVVPESFQPLPEGTGGRLVLRADSTAWATQVRLLLPTLRARLAEELGPGSIREVRVLGPGGPTWSAGPRRVRGRGPRDTYG